MRLTDRLDADALPAPGSRIRGQPTWDVHRRLLGDGGEHPGKIRQAVGVSVLARCRVRAAASVVVLAAAGCASGGGGPGAASTTPKRAVVDLAADTFPVGGAPWGVAVDGMTIWVGDVGRGALLRVDAASGDVLGEVDTGGPDPRDAGIAVRDGQVWVANLGGTVGVVDIATGQPVARISAGEGEPAAVTLDDRWAWVPTHGPGGGLVRLDRSNPRLDPLAIPLPESGFAAAVADGTVWVAGLERRLFAVDRDTGALERSIDVGGAPRGVAVADGDVWVTLRDERAVVRIDAVTGDEVARIDIGGQPWPIAAGRNTVWVASLEGRLLGIDPASNAVTARATVGPEALGVAVTDGAVWVTSRSGSLSRVAAS